MQDSQEMKQQQNYCYYIFFKMKYIDYNYEIG